MKNIHVIPTDKPSRLHTTSKGKLVLLNISIGSKGHTQNIYITNSEEIKKYGEYYLDIDTNEVKTSFKNMGKYLSNEKKIILTTDQDLIKDGVQAIDDDFLEWFVKNPSCEEVEVERTVNDYWKNLQLHYEFNYKIIIPKEEPKQENCCTPIGQIKRYVDCKGCDRKPKQIDMSKYTIGIDPYDTQETTLEEVAFRLYPKFVDNVYSKENESKRGVLRLGAKWQQEQYTIEEQHIGHTIDELDKEYIKGFNEGSAYYIERMYSEEDMIAFGEFIFKHTLLAHSKGVKNLFEQFKKK
jgi:hypothetical protein